MRSSPAAALLAASLSGCATSLWERTESFSSGGAEGRLYVPRVYAPLLPGSIYPDRKSPVPARGRPAIVVVCPEKGDCRESEILEQAGWRGMVVLIFKRPPTSPLKNDLLRTRAEASAKQTAWLLVAPTEDFLRRWIGSDAPGSATAVLEPPLPSFLSKQNLLPPLLFSSLLLSDGQPETPAGAILKLYAARPAGGLPDEAFRDAVEWLAGELGAR